MEFPDWYTDSVKRSRVYGRDRDFVGEGPLYPGPCPDAEKVKEQYKKGNIRRYSYLVSSVRASVRARVRVCVCVRACVCVCVEGERVRVYEHLPTRYSPHHLLKGYFPSLSHSLPSPPLADLTVMVDWA